METFQQLSVVFVLVLLGATLWVLRRKGVAAFALKLPGSGKTKSMVVIERMSLTPQHSLHLVRVGARTLLIAASPGGCSILEGFPEATADRSVVE